MSFLDEPISLISLGFGTRRKIGDIELKVVISESTTDVLTITKQPVQQGASITDHSFLEPTVLTMSAYFKDNLFTSLSKVYKNLQNLQTSRTPFDIVTPKRIYRSMLMSSLGLTTDKNTENILAINFSFQQVIIVNVSTTEVPRSKQKLPGATGATTPAPRKSALKLGDEGIGNPITKFLGGRT